MDNLSCFPVLHDQPINRSTGQPVNRSTDQRVAEIVFFTLVWIKSVVFRESYGEKNEHEAADIETNHREQ